MSCFAPGAGISLRLLLPRVASDSQNKGVLRNRLRLAWRFRIGTTLSRVLAKDQTRTVPGVMAVVTFLSTPMVEDMPVLAIRVAKVCRS
jgi:hypothetical protein